ncbi:hypothetical protein Tco_1476296 [Tanacetum coccineum]
MLRPGHHHPSVARGNIRVPWEADVLRVILTCFIKVCYWRFLHYRELKDKIWDPAESRGSRFQRSTLRTRNCPSREGMEGKSFEEELAEITETLKRLQSTLLFHQTKLKESFRQARQEFSLARQDISLATEKLHRSIKSAIKRKGREVKARPGHHYPSVARENIRVLGLNVQRVILDLFIKFAIGRFYTTRETKSNFVIPESRGSRFQRRTLVGPRFFAGRSNDTILNCPSREGMEGKSFEEELAEITETLKQLQSTLNCPTREGMEGKSFEEGLAEITETLKRLQSTLNCPSREGMEGNSFEEGLAEITDTLKRLQSTLLFHQTKLKESFRQARRDISLATEKLHRSIKAAIKEEVNH